MRLGGFDFTAGLWPTLATIVLMPLLVSLGVWQLERAAWKQALVDGHAEQTRQPALALADWLASGDLMPYRRVTARGRYDLDHQLLLDNSIHQGRAGYHVLTPLVLADTSEAVLVNRGWVPVGVSRAQLPALPGPEDMVDVQALVTYPPEKRLRLDSVEEPHAGWPGVVQLIEPGPLEQRLGYRLLPVVLLLDADAAHGFAREWRPVYGTTPDKHRAYALQWFTLATVLALIYIGVNTRRVSNEHE
ncbi:MAG: SURF1 family protein [Gammaproteobacteria bacterium]|nr:SURF1 family protein [Gammaproteobacteria bacterium]